MLDDARSVRSRTELTELLASWSVIPALLCDRHFTVVASNEAARALSPGFEQGMNLVRFTFLEPDIDRGHAMWGEAAGQVAALLRESLDEHDPDRDFRRIVGELSAHSRDFSIAWADESQAAKSRGIIPFDDTPVGRITVAYDVLKVPGSDDDVLLIWHPADELSRHRLGELLELRRHRQS